MPSEDVIAFAIELCSKVNIPVFQQEPNETFTPVGDDELCILPINDGIWIPNSDLPVKLLSVNVNVEANGTKRAVRGVPYEINSR